MFKHVLIPTDGSALSTEAAIKSIEFARSHGARATALVVLEPLPAGGQHSESMRAEHESGADAQADAVLAAIAMRAKSAGVDLAMLKTRGDDPYAAIIRVAEEQGCDMIAMASHGRRGIDAMVLGSQTLKVLTHSRIPVLVFR
jgi:nucleotide-binding universal stress UspA family protein